MTAEQMIFSLAKELWPLGLVFGGLMMAITVLKS